MALLASQRPRSSLSRRPSETMRQSTSASGSRKRSIWLGVVILLQLTGRAACLAATTNPSPSSSITSVVVSTKKNGGHSQTFTFHPEHDAQAVPKRNKSVKSLVRNVQTGLRSTFLPSGFPLNTPDGYLEYSIWSWVQDLSTQLRAVLATQRVLEGVGVGREGATALSALMNFIVRDGCGMAATLLFTSVAASRFKADIKRWRLFADIMVDIGITLEVAAAQVPTSFFLPMICVGNACKAICGVAAGACGGAINLHWATGSDISDINAKFGAQHTVTGSLGLVFAAFFAKSVSIVQGSHLWIIYSALTALHIFANMRCMRLIAFSSLNTIRMNLVVADFFEWWLQHSQEKKAPSPSLSSAVQVASREPLFFFPRWRRRKLPFTPINFGVSFNEFSEQSGKSVADLEAMLAKKTPYWISLGRSGIVVALCTDIASTDQAKAYFHALLLAKELETKRPSDIDERNAVEQDVLRDLDKAWKVFATRCPQAGWDLTTCELRTKGYEISIPK